MSKIDMSIMTKVKYSDTICWKRRTGRHWIEHDNIDSDGTARCVFCSTNLPSSEVERAIEERGKWRRSLTPIASTTAPKD